jgi:hypothetical protein
LLGRYGNDWSFLDKPMVITNKEGTGMEKRYSYVIIFRQIFYAGKNLKPNVIKKKFLNFFFPIEIFSAKMFGNFVSRKFLYLSLITGVVE